MSTSGVCQHVHCLKLPSRAFLYFLPSYRIPDSKVDLRKLGSVLVCSLNLTSFYMNCEVYFRNLEATLIKKCPVVLLLDVMLHCDSYISLITDR